MDKYRDRYKCWPRDMAHGTDINTDMDTAADMDRDTDMDTETDIGRDRYRDTDMGMYYCSAIVRLNLLCYSTPLHLMNSTGNDNRGISGSK
jgi:hypothetical protein